MKTRILAMVLLLCMCVRCDVYAEEKDYKVCDEKTTITYFISNNFQNDFNKTNGFVQELERATNVHVDWTIVSGSDLATQKTLMWSDTLPDVIGNISSDEVLMYSAQGALLPIDEYLDYMPNFVAAMNDGINDGIQKAITLEDGHIYALPAIGLAYYTNGAVQLINTKWLENLDLEMPTTVDELFEVLVAFRDNDANGNGDPDDEIPFTFEWSYYGNNRIGTMYAWFGVSPEIMYNDGVANYGPYMEDYKTMVKYFARMWEEKLIDPEVFTQENSTYSAKGNVSPSIYGVLNGWRKGLYMSNQNYDEYQVLPAQYCPDTQMSGAMRTHMGEKREWTLNRAVVSADTENPELVCAWLDTFYDPWYGSQVADGYIGAQLFQREDGQFQEVDTSQIPTQYANLTEWKNYTAGNCFPYYKAEQYCMYLSTSAQWAVEMNEQSEVYKDSYINDILYPSYQYSEEAEAILMYETDIEEYAKEMFALWVTGERDVEADWEEYIAELERLGVKEYIAANQAYYDRVMK